MTKRKPTRRHANDNSRIEAFSGFSDSVKDEREDSNSEYTSSRTSMTGGASWWTGFGRAG